MAWKYRAKYKNKKSKKVSIRKQRTTLAYQMGQILEGMKNPNSAVSASYQAGQDSVKNKKSYEKKPLW